jgi:hypothetical protein
VLDCGNFGCHSVDGMCSGGFCPGDGCTAKQRRDCAAMGAGCVDEVCSGGTAPGTGCTARQALIDCAALDAGCFLGMCTTADGPVTVDAGQPMPAPDDGGFVMPEPHDAGMSVSPVTPVMTEVDVQMGTVPTDLSPVKGGCSAVPNDLWLLGLALFALRRRH